MDDAAPMDGVEAAYAAWAEEAAGGHDTGAADAAAVDDAEAAHALWAATAAGVAAIEAAAAEKARAATTTGAGFAGWAVADWMQKWPNSDNDQALQFASVCVCVCKLSFCLCLCARTLGRRIRGSVPSAQIRGAGRQAHGQSSCRPRAARRCGS
jgi:hypothetical protein